MVKICQKNIFYYYYGALGAVREALGAVVPPPVELAAAQHLPQQWRSMLRQSAGGGGQWAGNSARTRACK